MNKFPGGLTEIHWRFSRALGRAVSSAAAPFPCVSNSERAGWCCCWLNTCGHYTFTVVTAQATLGGHLLPCRYWCDSRVMGTWWRSLVRHRGSSNLLLRGWCQKVTAQSDLETLGLPVFNRGSPPWVSKGEKSWQRLSTETWYPRSFNSNRKPLSWRQVV